MATKKAAKKAAPKATGPKPIKEAMTKSGLIAHIAEVTEGRRTKTREPGIAHFEAFGSLFFGAAEKLEALLEKEPDETVVMLDLSHVIYMDTTAFTTLETLHDHLASRDHTLILYGAPAQPERVLQSLLPVLGAENLLPDRESAFRRARMLLGDQAAAAEMAADRRASAKTPTPALS